MFSHGNGGIGLWIRMAMGDKSKTVPSNEKLCIVLFHYASRVEHGVDGIAENIMHCILLVRFLDSNVCIIREGFDQNECSFTTSDPVGGVAAVATLTAPNTCAG